VQILLFVVWPICFLIVLAGIVVAFRLWRARPANKVIRKVTAIYVAATTLTMVLTFIAVLVGVLKAFGAASGEADDPSQRARALAEGISEAMNCTAFGTLVALPLAIFVLVYAWRERTRSKAPQRR
jgi:biopolymer transport protein ExbB/TolQ